MSRLTGALLDPAIPAALRRTAALESNCLHLAHDPNSSIAHTTGHAKQSQPSMNSGTREHRRQGSSPAAGVSTQGSLDASLHGSASSDSPHISNVSSAGKDRVDVMGIGGGASAAATGGLVQGAGAHMVSAHLIAVDNPLSDLIRSCEV